MTSQKLRLAFRKQLVNEVAAEFDAVYESLVKREQSVFDDPTVHARYTEITFSKVAMHIVCGPVQLHQNRCDFLDTL